MTYCELCLLEFIYLFQYLLKFMNFKKNENQYIYALLCRVSSCRPLSYRHRLASTADTSSLLVVAPAKL